MSASVWVRERERERVEPKSMNELFCAGPERERSEV